MPTWATRVNLDIEIKYQGKDKRQTDEKRKLLKRRQAIKPIIVRLKAGHRMDRCHVKKQRVMRYTRVLCAAGYNMRWLMRMIGKKGQGLLLCLLQASGLTAILGELAEILGGSQPQNSG
jgi:transposase, IS5 family